MATPAERLEATIKLLSGVLQEPGEETMPPQSKAALDLVLKQLQGNLATRKIQETTKGAIDRELAKAEIRGLTDEQKLQLGQKKTLQELESSRAAMNELKKRAMPYLGPGAKGGQHLKIGGAAIESIAKAVEQTGAPEAKAEAASLRAQHASLVESRRAADAKKLVKIYKRMGAEPTEQVINTGLDRLSKSTDSGRAFYEIGKEAKTAGESVRLQQATEAFRIQSEKSVPRLGAKSFRGAVEQAIGAAKTTAELGKIPIESLARKAATGGAVKAGGIAALGGIAGLALLKNIFGGGGQQAPGAGNAAQMALAAQLQATGAKDQQMNTGRDLLNMTRFLQAVKMFNEMIGAQSQPMGGSIV